MSEELHPSSSKPSLDTGAMAVDALARRRVLLSGLGKGSVVLAAASVPMHTLASTSTRCKTDGSKAPPVWATVSGCHSAVGSRIPADTPVSQGHHCSHYTSRTCWPVDPRWNKSCADKTFSEVFGSGSSSKCIDIVTNKQGTSECYWVTAYLNSQTCGAYNYPYDSSEILKLYKNGKMAGNPTRSACESFFGTYMESMRS